MSETDLKLVERVKKGDSGAFEQIVNRYERTVFNSAYRIVGDIEDAADITQTTFVKVFEKIDSFNPAYKFFSWLYRISVNEAYNYQKRKLQAAEMAVEPKTSQPGPYEDFRQLEMCEHLERALATMTYDYRIVIVLKHLMLLSYKEIAEILTVPEKTIKSRLFSARQVLHRQLVEQGYQA
jgi:RNA polymerase sigma-70 factor (ECF subfamily)